MSYSHILRLPPELLVKVLQAFDSFDPLYALIRTSKRFNRVWQSHQIHIARSIILRCVPCLPDAEELAAVQEQYQCSYMKRTERLIRNARAAKIAHDLFVSELVLFYYPTKKGPPYLTDTESLRVTHAFYRVWTYICIIRKSIDDLDVKDAPGQYLAKMKLRELIRIGEFAHWIVTSLSNTCLKQLEMATAYTSGLDVRPEDEDWNDVWTASCLEVQKTSWSKFRRITHLIGPYIPREAPSNIYTVFDRWQEDVDLIPEVV